MLNRQLDLDLMFRALADPTRRAILERLSQGPASVSELAKPLPMSLPGVVQHLHILAQAAVITTTKTGRTRICKIDPAALALVEKWIDDRRRGLGRPPGAQAGNAGNTAPDFTN